MRRFPIRCIQTSGYGMRLIRGTVAAARLVRDNVLANSHSVFGFLVLHYYYTMGKSAYRADKYFVKLLWRSRNCNSVERVSLSLERFARRTTRRRLKQNEKDGG